MVKGVGPKNVMFIPLPLYCLELNPIENLWHYPRVTTCRTMLSRLQRNDAKHSVRLVGDVLGLITTQPLCPCGYLKNHETKVETGMRNIRLSIREHQIAQ